MHLCMNFVTENFFPISSSIFFLLSSNILYSFPELINQCTSLTTRNIWGATLIIHLEVGWLVLIQGCILYPIKYSKYFSTNLCLNYLIYVHQGPVYYTKSNSISFSRERINPFPFISHEKKFVWYMLCLLLVQGSAMDTSQGASCCVHVIHISKRHIWITNGNISKLKIT